MMSLIKRAQRMQQAQRPKQILRSLLESLYPDKVHLSELTQQLVNSIPLLTEHDQVLLISSPIDFLITFKPQILALPIRILLEQLHAEGKLEKQVKSIIDDENITLTEQQQALMENDLVEGCA